jgi:FAD synthase
MKVVFICGRMNPPTVGHERLIRAAQEVAKSEGSEAMVFATKTHDRERNPLEPDVKKTFAERAFGIPINLTTSPYSALEELVEKGADQITFMVGEDRLQHFQPLAKYATKLGVGLTLRSISRDANAASATRARQAVLENDEAEFARLVPSPHEGFSGELFSAVRRGIEVEDANVVKSIGGLR